MMDQDSLYEHVKTLSVDIGPRPFASDGEARAANYIFQKFKEYGIKSGLQSFRIKTYEYRTLAKILSPVEKNFLCIPYLDLFFHDGTFSVNASVTQFTNGGNISDRIILLPSGNFLPFENIIKANKNNAAAVLVYYISSGNSIKCPSLRDYIQRLSFLMLRRRTPIFLISEKDGHFISNLLKKNQVLMEILVHFTRTIKPSCNVIGSVGEGESSIIICAHYDSYWGTACPGACDNASGTAVLLEIAKVFSQFHEKVKKEIKFIAFSSEEYFAFGSLAYCFPSIAKVFSVFPPVITDFLGNKMALIPPRHIRRVEAMINIDNVGYKGPLCVGTNLTSRSAHISSEIERVLKKVINQFADNKADQINYFKSMVDSGDGRRFARLGVPTISLTRIGPGLAIYEHSTLDTIELISFEHLQKTAEFVYALTHALTLG